MSKRRKGLATPKGEAKNSLTHAKAIFSDLRQNTDPNATEQFVHRLNDFVRTAQTIPEFLRKEPRGPSSRIYTSSRRGVQFMVPWVNGFVEKLLPDARRRFDLLTELREVSSHDLAVRPEVGAISVEIFDSRSAAGNGAIDGNLMYQHDFGSPDASNAIQSTKTSIKYFLAGQQSEDVIEFCEQVLRVLEEMVEEAYKAFP